MSSSTNPKTILLRGHPVGDEATVITAAITPGMAVLKAGENVARAAAAATSPSFAREDELTGKGITDDYDVGDRCYFWTPQPGDQIYAWLADGQTIAAGASLSVGAGAMLIAATPAAQAPDTPFAVTFATPVVARALEAVTTDGAAARIKVEIV